MRVLMTADTVGGVWTYAIELARALRPHGVEVSLATMGVPPADEQLEQAGEAGNIDIRPSSYRLEWMEDPWDDVGRAGEWLLSLEREVRPDVVHLNGYVHASLPWSTPVLVVGHSCVMSWWQAVKGEPAPRSWDRYSHEVARGLHSAELVAAPTRTMLAALERHYGRFGNTRVIPNGRGAEELVSEGKQPFVLTAGRVWDEAKNVASVCAVADRLPWPVYVAGDAEHPDGGTTHLSGARFLGRVAPGVMASWYGRATIYALPARYEPFGLSALEASLAGCALVLGDIPSLREVWADSAVFVPPEDLDALADALNRLIANDSLRRDMASRAHSRALDYTPERMAQGYLSAYRDVLGRSHSRLSETRLSMFSEV